MTSLESSASPASRFEKKFGTEKFVMMRRAVGRQISTSAKEKKFELRTYIAPAWKRPTEVLCRF